MLDDKSGGVAASAPAPNKRPFNGKRDAKTGRFTKGNNAGNGRPKLPSNLKDALLPLGDKAVSALQAILDDPDARQGDKLRAAEIVLDRLLGKAAQPIVADVHQEEEPVTLAEMMARARELLGTDE